MKGSVNELPDDAEQRAKLQHALRSRLKDAGEALEDQPFDGWPTRIDPIDFRP
jgi:hypothetical protein